MVVNAVAVAVRCSALFCIALLFVYFEYLQRKISRCTHCMMHSEIVLRIFLVCVVWISFYEYYYRQSKEHKALYR